MEQSHELNLNLRFTLLWPSWLDYRVPTTSCTSRLKTKRLKTLSSYQENIAWIKSSWYYSTNIGGTFVIMSPRSKYWGDVSPCPIGIDAPDRFNQMGDRGRAFRKAAGLGWPSLAEDNGLTTRDGCALFTWLICNSILIYTHKWHGNKTLNACTVKISVENKWHTVSLLPRHHGGCCRNKGYYK